MNHNLEEQLVYLNRLKKEAAASLMKKPEGTLQISRNKNTEQYFYRSAPNIKKGEYIRKENMTLIRSLAQKSYDQKFIAAVEDLEKKMHSLASPWNSCSMHDLYQFLAAVYQDLTPSRQLLVTPYVMPDDMFIRSWLDVRYAGKPFLENDQEIYSKRGERVRSKSEKFIADLLWELGIPYRYEYPLKTKRLGIIFPDFTLLDVWNRRIVIFEHFGMMQDAKYCNLVLTKLEVYEEEGFFPGRDFLFTMESSDHIINLEHFERLMRDRFFLNHPQ